MSDEPLIKASEVAAWLGYTRTNSFLLRWKAEGYTVTKGAVKMVRTCDYQDFLRRNTTGSDRLRHTDTETG